MLLGPQAAALTLTKKERILFDILLASPEGLTTKQLIREIPQQRTQSYLVIQSLRRKGYVETIKLPQYQAKVLRIPKNLLKII